MIKLIKNCTNGGVEDTVYLKLLRIPPFGIKTASKIPIASSKTNLAALNE